MHGTHTDLGTLSWVERTGGRLSAAERRSPLRPLLLVPAVMQLLGDRNRWLPEVARPAAPAVVRGRHEETYLPTAAVTAPERELVAAG